MGDSSFFTQTLIYYRKIRRIAFREKFWKFVVFALIISLLVAGVIKSDMFDTYESTKSGFFTIASAGIWIGIFNSIQSICKEHKIIRSDYRSGMKISSYVTANMIWQLVISIIQSFVLMGIFSMLIDFNSDGIILSSSWWEYYITVFLVTYGADVMGIMISSIAGNATTAMTIMPFVLILQLIMSGVLFDLSGWSEKLSYITFSKWGMSSLGSIADLNNNSDFPSKISETLKNIPPREVEDCYNHTLKNLLTSWSWCIGITIVCYFTSIISLKIKNRIKK